MEKDQLKDSNNLLECALYGDIEIMPCRMHEGALKKMASLK